MTTTAVTIIGAALLGALMSGLVGWACNYHVQHRIHRDFREIDELKNNFYNYLALSTNYWIGTGKSETKRRALEAQMITLKCVILTNYNLLAKRHKRIRTSRQATEEYRLDLWDAAEGGCFQQKTDWKPSNDRARKVAATVTRIVKSFY